MKKIISLMIVICATIFVGITSFANDIIHVTLDGKNISFDVPPQIISDRTMVPIREIFEKMGASVEWDSTTGTAICTKGDTVVKMTVGSLDMYVNNQVRQMDVSPVIIAGRTLAPARYVAEAFGADVQWSQKNRTVVICSKDVYAYADYPDIPNLGKCYNITVTEEGFDDGFKYYSYIYYDTANEYYHSYLFDNSAFVLGAYTEEVVESDGDSVLKGYKKPGESEHAFFVDESHGDYNSKIFVVLIPVDSSVVAAGNKVTLYAADGSSAEVSADEVYTYLASGWYRTLAETKQIMYAPDGRTLIIFKSEVNAYKIVGWYETREQAQNANKPASASNNQTGSVNSYNPYGSYNQSGSASSYNPYGTYNPSNSYNASTSYNAYNSGASYSSNIVSQSSNFASTRQYYRTPTGERYHFDPDCGGKNSYITTDIYGLYPCSKCTY